MAGQFELKKNKNGQFHFVLKAGNSETILSSESYKSKTSALKGIASVQNNCRQEGSFEKKVAVNGKHTFNLKATNHRTIGSSQMYSSPKSRETGIASVMLNGKTKTVKDNT